MDSGAADDGESRGRQRWARGAPWVLLLASAAVFVASVGSMARALAVSIGSDSLYLDGLYRDIFVDKVPIHDWAIQPAPSFFPDLPLLFALRAVLGSAVLANCAYGVAQLVIEAVLVAALLRALGARSVAAWSAGLLTIGAVAFCNSLGDYNHLLFYPSTHASCIWIGLAGALVVVRQYPRGRFSPWAGVSLVALTALTAGSDELYLLVGAIPLCAASLVNAVAFPASPSIGLFSAASTGLGIALSSWVRRAPALFDILVPPKAFELVISRERMHQAFANWPPPDHEPRILRLQQVLLVAGMAMAAWIVARSLRGRRPAGFAHRREATFLAAAFLGSVLFTVSGVVFGGFWWDSGGARYLQPLFVFPYVIVGAWLCLTSSPLLRSLAVLALVGLMLPWPRLSKEQRQASRANLLYPPAVACIDRLSRRYDARYGYGDYWNARKTTELSHNHLRILPVSPSFTEYGWIANRLWFSQAPTGSSDFLLLPSRLEEGAVKSRLGPPERVEECAGEPVWVYAGPPRERPPR